MKTLDFQLPDLGDLVEYNNRCEFTYGDIEISFYTNQMTSQELDLLEKGIEYQALVKYGADSSSLEEEIIYAIENYEEE